MSLNVTLSADLEEKIAQKVRQGEFPSVDELVSEAVQRFLAEEGENIEELRAMLAKADEQIERGEYTEYDAQSLRDFGDRIKAEGARWLEERSTKRDQ
jgi:Arc/MetJ-type ribon-helix-helix transcriptional regulator